MLMNAWVRIHTKRWSVIEPADVLETALENVKV